eukprot:TRINITY_DN10367_c0_g1_i2.p2 TRINITY_DN10367_c0_g1~~TRINITY_DN10367_c0_g1_i2.p2  ORF type:complete len:106 (-),score=18.44 TRINITY_DN10367_c0_g1_i2:88-405(-)
MGIYKLVSKQSEQKMAFYGQPGFGSVAPGFGPYGARPYGAFPAPIARPPFYGPGPIPAPLAAPYQPYQAPYDYPQYPQYPQQAPPPPPPAAAPYRPPVNPDTPLC